MSRLEAIIESIESKGAILGLLIIVLTTIGLKIAGLLDYNVVSVLEWAGSTFFGAQAASHICTMSIGSGSQNVTPPK